MSWAGSSEDEVGGNGTANIVRAFSNSRAILAQATCSLESLSGGSSLPKQAIEALKLAVLLAAPGALLRYVQYA